MLVTKNVAAITAVTGQYGASLAELPLKKDCQSHGMKGRSSLFKTDRVNHLCCGPRKTYPRSMVRDGDLTKLSSLIGIAQHAQPDEIFNLYAHSHGSVSFEKREYTADADSTGALRILLVTRHLGLERKAASTSLASPRCAAVSRQTGSRRPCSSAAVAPTRCQALSTLDHDQPTCGFMASTPETACPSVTTARSPVKPFALARLAAPIPVLAACWRNASVVAT